MKLTKKHKLIFKVLGFTFLVALMVILNNHKNDQETISTSASIELVNSNEGTISTSANIPNTTEHTLPIKLLSNTKANFLFFVNQSKNKLRNVKFNQQRWLFLAYQTHLSNFYLIKKYTTSKNKEIQ